MRVRSFLPCLTGEVSSPVFPMRLTSEPCHAKCQWDGDEFFPLPWQRVASRPHSITLSARATSAGGTVTPSALAVLRLIASSNLLGCSTGISATLTHCRSRQSKRRRVLQSSMVVGSDGARALRKFQVGERFLLRQFRAHSVPEAYR